MANANISRESYPCNHRLKAFLFSLIPLLIFVVLTFDKEERAFSLFSSANSSAKTEVPPKCLGDHKTGEASVGLKEEPCMSGDAPSSNALGVPENSGILDPDGPVPVIIMSAGRSGSSSICQVICALTGSGSDEQPNGCNLREEFPGHARWVTFFETADREGRWLFERLREKQNRYPRAGATGFKWKPYAPFDAPAVVGALRAVAASKFPTVKIVRSRRNPLDFIISRLKHTQPGVPAHCRQGDAKCIKRHFRAASNLVLPTENLVEILQNETNQHDQVDRTLVELNVPHVRVTYEELHFGQNREEEWMKIFRFLGVGPGEGLTRAQLDVAMRQHALTSSTMHNVTLANFDEVEKVLRGTEFEKLLHR